ncbi:hypothetical protein Vretimale_15261 [Volvox reticuliferus]|uniref:Protein kinase domain-containing protein n=1 Tax=Volvox reticuliferus TaxID=1737510 RepID=A0A8J4LVI1_9CHLO|nr:hypothetical protein Vretimale_15261 [Volvox reticuliferus]
MKETASSAMLAPSVGGATSYRGASVTLPHSAQVSGLNGLNSSVGDSVLSTIDHKGACNGAGPSPSFFAWDVDGAHTQALVSPVMLSGKKKGGLLYGLKKIFNHSSKADGRAATGQGQRGTNPSVTSSDGTGVNLDPSISSKMDRSLKYPSSNLHLQANSSRDLSLAALLTSPVRGGSSAAPGSPAVLNSPMPSMRFDQISSSNMNVTLSLAESDASYHNGSNPTIPGEQQQRLFTNFKNGRHAAGQVLYSSTPQLAASVSGQLFTTKPSWGGANPLQSGTPQQAMQQQQQLQLGIHQQPGLLHKSYSTAHPTATSVASSSNLSTHLARGDSVDDYSTSGSGTNGRIALPYIASLTAPRQDGSCHGGGAAASLSSGRASAASPQSPAAPDVDFAAPCDADYEACEEDDDDQEGSVLLGMNPAVPPAMRRRKWKLDDYQIAKRMYKGSTSAVYRATCMRSGIAVALKVYFLNKVPSNVVHMIRREIGLHVRLVHRNIIMLYAAFQDEKHIVLVEEFAARGDLFGIHRSMNCRLTETQTSELILAPFLDALSYLHARGIMHRDIKPENILFTNEWTLKIADFGVSINVHDERAVTRTGTADYMAPEVERCPLKHAPEDNKNNPHLAYTPAIDIWSVGVLAYEMLVGFPPFVSNDAGEDSGSRQGVAAFLAEQATRKTLRFPASISAAAKDFIMATLNENPGDRPTAQQLLKHPWLFKAARAQGASHEEPHAAKN